MACVFTLVSCMLLMMSTSYGSPTEVPGGICQCAVFKENADPLTANPLVVKNTEIEMTTCDEGQKECNDLCVALAEAAKAEAPKVLCDAVKEDINNLKVTVYYKLAESWVNTGKTSTVPICCKSNLPVTCLEISAN